MSNPAAGRSRPGRANRAAALEACSLRKLIAPRSRSETQCRRGCAYERTAAPRADRAAAGLADFGRYDAALGETRPPPPRAAEGRRAAASSTQSGRVAEAAAAAAVATGSEGRCLTERLTRETRSTHADRAQSALPRGSARRRRLAAARGRQVVPKVGSRGNRKLRLLNGACRCRHRAPGYRRGSVRPGGRGGARQSLQASVRHGVTEHAAAHAAWERGGPRPRRGSASGGSRGPALGPRRRARLIADRFEESDARARSNGNSTRPHGLRAGARADPVGDSTYAAGP